MAPLVIAGLLYQVWAKSNNLWLSYSDLQIENLGRPPYWIWSEVDFVNFAASRDPQHMHLPNFRKKTTIRCRSYQQLNKFFPPVFCGAGQFCQLDGPIYTRFGDVLGPSKALYKFVLDIWWWCFTTGGLKCQICTFWQSIKIEFCEVPWERMPYLSALEVCSRQGAIQIHVFLYLYIAGIGNVDFFAPVTLTLTRWPSYTNLTRIPWRYIDFANMNFLRSGFRKLSSHRQTPPKLYITPLRGWSNIKYMGDLVIWPTTIIAMRRTQLKFRSNWTYCCCRCRD